MLDTGDVVQLQTVIDHSRCHAGTCERRVKCPTCGENTWPREVKGRWDDEGGHTARPFVPVHVTLACGCTFGDAALARPSGSTSTPGTGSDS